MKLKLITLFFLSAISIKAQENPFESIGKQGEILTLSNGKYKEIHSDDSLQQIGSVIVNMNTGKICGFIVKDTMYSEATLDPTVISRWYSLDPLAAKYTSISPYAFCANNPIIYVDGDGQEVIPSDAFKSNQKLYAVLSVAQKTTIYNQLVKNYTTGTEDLYLGYSPNPSTMVAYTSFYLAGDNNEFSRTFSVTAFSNWNLKIAGTEQIVGTKDFSSSLLASVLFHEVIHANINLYESVNTDLGDDRYNLFCDYKSKYSDQARAEHEFIADNFRNDLSQGLKEFDQAQNSPVQEDKYYNALAWGGLTHYRDENGLRQETDAWKKYKETASGEEVDYIIKTIENENSNVKMSE